MLCDRWFAPERAKLGFVFEEFGELSVEALQKLLSRHRLPVRTPKRSGCHVLNGAFFSVGELHLNLGARRQRPRSWARPDWGCFSDSRFFALFRLNRFAVPFGIIEVVMRL